MSNLKRLICSFPFFCMHLQTRFSQSKSDLQTKPISSLLLTLDCLSYIPHLVSFTTYIRTNHISYSLQILSIYNAIIRSFDSQLRCLIQLSLSSSYSCHSSWSLLFNIACPLPVLVPPAVHSCYRCSPFQGIRQVYLADINGVADIHVVLSVEDS